MQIGKMIVTERPIIQNNSENSKRLHKELKKIPSLAMQRGGTF